MHTHDAVRESILQSHVEAALKGHDLTPFAPVDANGFQTTCKVCGGTIWMGISGPCSGAVFLSCSIHFFSSASRPRRLCHFTAFWGSKKWCKRPLPHCGLNGRFPPHPFISQSVVVLPPACKSRIVSLFAPCPTQTIIHKSILAIRQRLTG